MGPNIRTQMSQYPAGFPNGMTARNVPMWSLFPGRVVWVDSNFGSDSNRGTFDRPYATIGGAQTGLAATSGTISGGTGLTGAWDTILCKPGHSETVTAAAGINLSQAGLRVIGLGTERSKMPTINFTTATTATLKISAADVWFSGFLLTCGIASQATMLDIVATGAMVTGNIFSEGTQTGLSFVNVGAVTATANIADRTHIINNVFQNPTAGNMNHAVCFTTVHDQCEVGNNVIRGNFALSGIHNITGNVCTNMLIHDNDVTNLTAAKPAMNLISACTGRLYGNNLIQGDSTVANVLGSLTLGIGNYDIGGSMDAGAFYVFKKLGVVSSTITQAGVDISTASVAGQLSVVDIQVQTNATGLAAGTNFQVTSNNVSGLAVMFAETVANLGANKTMNLANASVTKTGGVLETGKKFTLKSTVADCTGAGTIDIYITLRRATAGAFVPNV